MVCESWASESFPPWTEWASLPGDGGAARFVDFVAVLTPEVDSGTEVARTAPLGSDGDNSGELADEVLRRA